jgi:hypothetical protein
MAVAIRAHGLTGRQAHTIVTALLGTTDPAARDDVLADPLRHVRATAPTPTRTDDPRLGAGGNEVRRSLFAVGGAAERVARMVTWHAPAGLDDDDARILGPLVTRTLRASGETTALLERLARDSGVP